MNTTFQIEAKTCSLKINTQKGSHILLGDNDRYEIPIYQRPYSWSEPQISKFISDIFLSYWGNDNTVINEPMFIGTMQLSAKEDGPQLVIDGQQRLTTLLMLLRVLQNEFPDAAIDFDHQWLTTRVNNGKQQQYLSGALSVDLDANNDDTLNPYLQNARLLRSIFREHIRDDPENATDFDTGSFYLFIVSKLYFVVIETKATLSKTLQIFNAINTTGLDLNGGDLFKVRFYEYLTSRQGYGEEVFEQISELYRSIDENNEFRNYAHADIDGILSIYRYMLIAKYNLPYVLYTLATPTFFERLFDTLLHINQWEHYSNAKAVELSLDDLQGLIKVRYLWEDSKYPSAENACAMHLLWDSRYGKHWIIIFVYLFRFKYEPELWTDFWEFSKQLAKWYVIYSIRFQKAITHVHTKTYHLMEKLMGGSVSEALAFINAEIGSMEKHKGHYDLEMTLNGNIAYNAKMKNIICRLSAMLEENYTSTDTEEINQIRDRLFHSHIDVEHIQSYHHKDGTLNKGIWEAWGTDINSLGNLMVLEQHINRSIRNDDYPVKHPRYIKSMHPIVQKHSAAYTSWGLDKCLERKKAEVEKITGYLFPTPAVAEKCSAQVLLRS